MSTLKKALTFALVAVAMGSSVSVSAKNYKAIENEIQAAAATKPAKKPADKSVAKTTADYQTGNIDRTKPGNPVPLQTGNVDRVTPGSPITNKTGKGEIMRKVTPAKEQTGGPKKSDDEKKVEPKEIR